jgi:hypothetical protein
MKILVITPDLPFPPIGGAQVRTYHLVKGLAEHHDVTMIGFIGDRGPASPDLSVRLVEIPWGWPESYKAMKSADPADSQRAFESLTRPTGEPWFVSCYQLPAMENAVRTASSEGFDAVWIEHTSMARFLPCLPTNVPKLLDFVDVHSLITRRAVMDASE